MLLIVCLMIAIIWACITAGQYESGNFVLFIVGSFITATFFTVYMVGIQS